MIKQKSRHNPGSSKFPSVCGLSRLRQAYVNEHISISVKSLKQMIIIDLKHIHSWFPVKRRQSTGVLHNMYLKFIMHNIRSTVTIVLQPYSFVNND